jgi:hypothetical protein
VGLKAIYADVRLHLQTLEARARAAQRWRHGAETGAVQPQDLEGCGTIETRKDIQLPCVGQDSAGHNPMLGITCLSIEEYYLPVQVYRHFGGKYYHRLQGRLRQHILLKRYKISTKLHGILSQNTVLFIVTESKVSTHDVFSSPT